MSKRFSFVVNIANVFEKTKLDNTLGGGGQEWLIFKKVCE